MSHTYQGPEGYNPTVGTTYKGRAFNEGDMPPELWEQWLKQKWLVKAGATVAKSKPSMEDMTDG